MRMVGLLFVHKPQKFGTGDLRGHLIGLIQPDVSVPHTGSLMWEWAVRGNVQQAIKKQMGSGSNERSRRQTEIWESVITEVTIEARSRDELQEGREKDAGLQARVWIQERKQEGRWAGRYLVCWLDTSFLLLPLHPHHWSIHSQVPTSLSVMCRELRRLLLPSPKPFSHNRMAGVLHLSSRFGNVPRLILFALDAEPSGSDPQHPRTAKPIPRFSVRSRCAALCGRPRLPPVS